MSTSTKVKNWRNSKPHRNHKKIVSLTVGNKNVIPLTVGNDKVIPMTIRDDQHVDSFNFGHTADEEWR